jgi:membrane associated rhomboid family serine protease
MLLLPIGTDVRPRRPPLGNWALIAANIAMFVLTDMLMGAAGERLKNIYALDAARPELWQYLTYQFMHGDVAHLLGNMLFLWIFGDAVCDRMGSVCYLIFYLAGGVFAGVVFAGSADNPMIGASGAIAGVTTAFLVLFPRVHVTMLFWLFLFLTTFQIPAMILIVFKIILWDNVLAPAMDRGLTSNVAYSAHLGGYAFGFLVALLMLVVRALPRNQFDALALWGRWRRRSGYVDGIPRGGPGARLIDVREMASRPLEALQLTPIEALREQIVERITDRDMAEAARLHGELLTLDPAQVLPRNAQLELANFLAHQQRHDAAAAAYEGFLAAYPAAPDAHQVRLLLGLIYNRYLRAPERAVAHLRGALAGLHGAAQGSLAADELRRAELALAGGGQGD